MSSYAILILLCTFSFSSPTPIQKRYFSLKYDWGSDESFKESPQSTKSEKADEEAEPAPVQEKNDGERTGRGKKHFKGASSAAAAGVSAAATASADNPNNESNERGKKKEGVGSESDAASAFAASSGGGKESSTAAAALVAPAGTGDDDEADVEIGNKEEGKGEKEDEVEDNGGNEGGRGDEKKEGGGEENEQEGNNVDEEKAMCSPGGAYSAATSVAAAAAAVATGGEITSAIASAAVTSQVFFSPFKLPSCPCAPTGQYRNMDTLLYSEMGGLRNGKKSVGNYIDLELEQYVVSMVSVTGLRLRPANCDGTGRKESYLTAMRPPDRYNLAQPCELWVFEPHFVSGKRVYQIRNVQRGLYLRASPHLYRKYYHVCGLKTRDTDDMSMYWDLTGWSIRNLLYDEYLTHSPRNAAGYGMTHPITKDMVTWVLTKKSDLSKVTANSFNRNKRNAT